MRKLVIIGLAVPIAAIAATIALATPGSGILGGPVIARGTLDGQFKLKLHDSSNTGDVVVQQVLIAPGGSTGWHTHPGPALVLVKSGEFTLYEGDAKECEGTAYETGEVVVDRGYGNVHFGRNEGSQPLELYVVYLDVPATGAFRLDVPRPADSTCSF